MDSCFELSAGVELLEDTDSFLSVYHRRHTVTILEWGGGAKSTRGKY